MIVRLKRTIKLEPGGVEKTIFVDAPLIQIVDRQPERDSKGNTVFDEYNRKVMVETVYKLTADPKVEGGVTEFVIPDDEHHARMIQDLKDQVMPTKRTIQTFDDASKRMVKRTIEDVQNIGRFIELVESPKEPAPKPK